MKLLIATAATCLLALTGPPAVANSPELQAVTIPASACQLQSATAAKPKMVATYWTLQGNSRAWLACPLPVAGRGGTVLDRVRITYVDPDGRAGNASVKAVVGVTTMVTPTGPLSILSVPCFLSNFDGLVATTMPTATIVDSVCQLPVTIPPGGYVSIFIELWRRGTADFNFAPSFMGIDFP